MNMTSLRPRGLSDGIMVKLSEPPLAFETSAGVEYRGPPTAPFDSA